MAAFHVGAESAFRNAAALQDRKVIEAMIEALIATLDQMDGDPDSEPTGDELDAAWPEWDRRSADGKKAGREIAPSTSASLWHASTEDDEQDDFPEEDDPSGMNDEDGINTGGEWIYGRHGPGCPISDPGGSEDGAIRPTYGTDQTLKPTNAYDFGYLCANALT